MTKVSIKNEIIFNFGGIYHVADKFDQTIGKTIVETLGKRHSINAVYQFDEVFRAITCNYIQTDIPLGRFWIRANCGCSKQL